MKIIIPEGSIIDILINSDKSKLKTVTCNSEIVIEEDTIIWGINKCLVITDSVNPVVKISENQYQINVWWHDALILTDEILLQSWDDL